MHHAERHREAGLGFYPPEHPLFGKPKLRYGHDPERAKQLLADAGYGPNKRPKAKIMISTVGLGTDGADPDQ